MGLIYMYVTREAHAAFSSPFSVPVTIPPKICRFENKAYRLRVATTVCDGLSAPEQEQRNIKVVGGKKMSFPPV